MSGFDELGIQLTDLLAPWIAILISISAAFWFKDFATNMMIGLKYRSNSHFNEGDHVILDGKDAIIVKFGMRETVFGIYTDRGYVWRFIPNDKLPNQKLEKIINKNLHLDTDEEKGRRMQEMIDKAQDDKIAKNKEAIENLKN
ncbi:MAG: hypothetical protein CMK23_06565 [Porticoccaceae bacterium]|jgi:hypothetical protein|nr:hypothetical protein [Porticoccaceae bacterium]|tara:strand:- start:1405 stop:1833 length:429 start_codon:yes stop_codon:yes gene_type:complete